MQNAKRELSRTRGFVGNFEGEDEDEDEDESSVDESTGEKLECSLNILFGRANHLCEYC